MRSFIVFSMCLTSLFVSKGCTRDGLPMGEVSGVVTVDGKPIDNAFVEFQPADGRPSLGITDSSGAYSLNFTNDTSGALIGSHIVRITTEITGVKEGDVGGPVAGRKELLPSKYHSQSELTAEVRSGSNTFNFDLTTTK